MSVNSICCIAVDGKRKEIDQKMKDILSVVEDYYILDHTIGTLTQLSRSLHTHLEKAEDSNVHSDFPIKEGFEVKEMIY